jgi:glutaredoxin 3
MPQLALYQSAGCPYCQKVLRFMQQKGITLPLKNTMEGANREDLIKIGGKPQVPCLVIDGKALYESDDIIAWLEKNWKKQ